MKYTFDSRGELQQPVHDLEMIDWCLRTQGFVVYQFDKDGNQIVESGKINKPKAKPLKVVKADLKRGENWSMLELDPPEQPKTESEIEQEWLAEQAQAERERLEAEKRGDKPQRESSEFGTVIDKAGDQPIMNKIFGSDWSEDDGVFELRATAKKKGLKPSKKSTKADLVAMLRAHDSKAAS
jgi:hypothetical protein